MRYIMPKKKFHFIAFLTAVMEIAVIVLLKCSNGLTVGLIKVLKPVN
jgi:hypothetical protein